MTTTQQLGRPGSRQRTMSPRRRARLSRAIQYAVLLVVLAAVVIAADWDRVGETMFNPTVAREMLPSLGQAMGNTIVYTIAAFAVGLSLGTVLALMRLSSVRVYRWIATLYIEFFRGIPALLVVLTVGFAVPIAFDVRISSLTAKVAIGLGMVSAAYIAETLRAGIQAVPKGQIEAARSLGMSQARTMAVVVIPQAFRIVLPPMTNEVILLTKDTSLVFLLGMTAAQYDLTKIGREALTSATGGLTGLFVVGACYLCLTIPLGLLARWLENRSGKGRRA